MEPLIELPAERWPELYENLKKTWPLNLPGYYTLKLQLEHPELRQAFQFKVYCVNGEIEHGFIATSIKGIPDCIFFPNSLNTKVLEKGLIETQLIAWSHPQRLCVDLISSSALKCLYNVKSKICFSHFEVGPCKALYFCKDKPHFSAVKCPSNTCVKPVKQENIRQVDDTWAYKHPGSYNYFRVLIKAGLSYGLYSDDQLLAWVFINEYYFFGHLFVVERYRRQGFGEFLIKFVTNELLNKGNDVYTYVIESNEKSLGLFRKLGFEEFDEAAFAMVQK